MAVRIIKGTVNKIVQRIMDWGSLSSLWPVHFVTGCCSPEEMALFAPRFDAERFGVLLAMGAMRQCDLLMVIGHVSYKMADRVKHVYDQMPEPKYVMAVGQCATSGGFYYDSYSILKGVDKIIPVDVYVTGCPPRPEAWIEAFLELQRIIREGRSS